MPERVVIVGASLAGLRAAQAVRSAGHDGALVVVGDQRHAPYTRPPLSRSCWPASKSTSTARSPAPTRWTPSGAWAPPRWSSIVNARSLPCGRRARWATTA